MSKASNCINCQRQLRLDPSLKKSDDSERRQIEFPEGLDGVSCNLLKIICDSTIPSETPVCKECADDLKKDLEMQQKTLTDECKMYEEYLQKLEKSYPADSYNQLKKQLDELRIEEDQLNVELEKHTKREAELDRTIVLDRQKLDKELDEESKLWRYFRDNHRKLLDLSESITQLDSEIRYADVQHRRLSGMNILDTCFYIFVDDEDGTIGQINGFSLGRLPHKPVEWPEINAAFGQLVFLLNVLLERADVRLETLTPVPMGSYSYIQVKRNGVSQNLPLYGSGAWVPFGNNNIDPGILALMQCFEALHEALKRKEFSMTFRIHNDKFIRENLEYSAKMMFNNEERWTKAMKMLLTNLKCAMLFVVSMRPPS